MKKRRKRSIPVDKELRAKNLQSQQRVIGCLSNHEIGRRLGISYGRVYQIGLRAIAKIRLAVLCDPEFRQLVEDVCGITIDADSKRIMP